MSSKKKHTVKPDDYMRFGSMEFARFGKHLFARNNMNPEQFKIFQSDLAEQFPEICREIDDKISKIANIVSTLPPDKVLQRAYWEMASHHFDIADESKITHKEIISLRMVDYLQSVIASVKPIIPYKEEITEEVWHELRELVDSLFSQLNLEYQICYTAHKHEKDPDFDTNLEEFYFKAQVYWCNIRGNRYLVHEVPFLKEVLSPHDTIFLKLFGIDTNKFTEELSKILYYLSQGITDLVHDLKEFQKKTLDKLEDKLKSKTYPSEIGLADLMTQVIEENEWEAWKNNIFGRFLYFDLFDIRKITDLPQELLSKLSWEPGQNDEFFSPGEFQGWPLRIWPIFERPFIKINDNYYCFELYNLFDNIYRTIQRIIFSIAPEYIPQWNFKQQEASEQIPFNLFNKILPGAKIIRSIYYKWHPSPGKAKEWCENDGVVIYGDHLIIVEIKAGAFTYTPPTTDFPAYLDSIRNLILKPAKQGKRFLEYLDSQNKVNIFDAEHNVIGTISKNDFAYITLCTITLDSITKIAVETQYLSLLDASIGKHPIWSLSIDDLRVYSDIFDNPLIFLHFLEHRMRAQKSHLVEVSDELDHLGLYLAHNAYTQYVKDLNFDGKMQWIGYRSRIDEYFAQKIIDPSLKCNIHQKMPHKFKEIINLLYVKKGNSARRVSSFLLDFSGAKREELSNSIDNILKHIAQTKSPKSFSVTGSARLTLFCWQEGICKYVQGLAIDHTRAVMVIGDETERLLLELYYSASGELNNIDFKFVDLNILSTKEMERIRSISRELVKKRFAKAKMEQGTIGRNQPCPCGSGKKYKKCCLKRTTSH